jgi:hypothetical protein
MLKITPLILIMLVLVINVTAQTGLNELKINKIKSSLIKPELSINNKISVKKQKDFSFSTNLYLWALTINGTTAMPVNRPPLTITQTPELDIDFSFSEALKYVKFGIMLAGKFIYKDVGLLYDVYYGNLEYNGTTPVASTYINGTLAAKQFTGDFALLYSFPVKNKKFSFTAYAGARVISFDNTIDLLHNDNSILSENNKKTWVDPIFGTDIRYDLSKHWLTYFKGDFGGFGVSSKFTSSIIWTIGYKFTEHWNTNLGVKYLYINYDKDNFLWNVSQYGTLLSAGYVF